MSRPVVEITDRERALAAENEQLRLALAESRKETEAMCLTADHLRDQVREYRGGAAKEFQKLALQFYESDQEQWSAEHVAAAIEDFATELRATK